VDVAVVEACQHDGLGVHHGGGEAEEPGLEAGVVDFEVGLHGLAAEGALGGVLQLAHVAGAVDVVEALSVDHHDVAFQHGEVLVGLGFVKNRIVIRLGFIKKRAFIRLGFVKIYYFLAA